MADADESLPDKVGSQELLASFMIRPQIFAINRQRALLIKLMWKHESVVINCLKDFRQ